MATGVISQIIGPVLDLQFAEENIPAIYNAVEIPLERQPESSTRHPELDSGSRYLARAFLI